MGVLSPASDASLNNENGLLAPISDLDDLGRRAYYVGLVVLPLAGLAITLTAIGVPLPWVDEAATLLALRRSWTGIIDLVGGPDAPLVPYYLLAKAWASALSWLPQLLAVRALSAVAAAGTVAAVYVLAAKRAGLATAVIAAGFLMAMPGFSRYGQEARPYALLACFAALSWLAWDSWHQSSGRDQKAVRRALGVAYVGSLAGGVLMQLFAFLQWPAQLLADATSPRGELDRRRERVFRSVLAMVVAVVFVAIPVVLAAANGTGTTHRAPRRSEIAAQLIRVVGFQPEPWLVAVVALTAACAIFAGVFQGGRFARCPDFTRVVTIWFAVPLVLTSGLALLRPQFLQVRYFQTLLAPLALLAALGCVFLADLISRAINDKVGRQAIAPIAGIALLLPLVVQVGIWLPAERQIRAIGGHDPGVAPAMVLLDSELALRPGEPVLLTSSRAVAIILASRPELADRMLNYTVPLHDASIWPEARTAAEVERALGGQRQAIWMRATTSSKDRPQLPASFAQLGFVAIGAQRAGNWWAINLQR